MRLFFNALLMFVSCSINALCENDVQHIAQAAQIHIFAIVKRGALDVISLVDWRMQAIVH
ncbi:hypothetical protein MnTg02_01718 [bacterium MnTg02]|nr:hypothetical protein MnTg02_01718 [bacterium MnTg02]